MPSNPVHAHRPQLRVLPSRLMVDYWPFGMQGIQIKGDFEWTSNCFISTGTVCPWELKRSFSLLPQHTLVQTLLQLPLSRLFQTLGFCFVCSIISPFPNFQRTERYCNYSTNSTIASGGLPLSPYSSLSLSLSHSLTLSLSLSLSLIRPYLNSSPWVFSL